MSGYERHPITERCVAVLGEMHNYGDICDEPIERADGEVQHWRWRYRVGPEHLRNWVLDGNHTAQASKGASDGE